MKQKLMGIVQKLKSKILSLGFKKTFIIYMSVGIFITGLLYVFPTEKNIYNEYTDGTYRKHKRGRLKYGYMSYYNDYSDAHVSAIITSVGLLLLWGLSKSGAIINKESIVYNSVADELSKLKLLKDENMITQEEFDTQKNKLMK